MNNTNIRKIDILDNGNFFDWLVDQMNKHYYALYNRESKEENVKKIPLLYKLVHNYAMENNLTPIMMINYNIYYVNYNGCIFSVFEHISDTTFEYGCYANFLEKNSIPYYISFDDIKNSNSDYISRILIDELKEKIQKLMENGLSSNAICELVSGICNDLNQGNVKGK